MRGTWSGAKGMLEERRLSGLTITHGTLKAYLRGLAFCISRPALVGRLLMWLLRFMWNRPLQLVKSLALVPRAMDILIELKREQPDVVHLFWGHYPSIVGWLVVTALPNTVLSMFLGAYDLVSTYNASAWVAQRADLVSTHTRANVTEIEALGVSRERIHLVYRGIDLTWFNVVEGCKVRHRIVSAGRLEEAKGIRDVLLVFREVLERWPNATLRILGEGRDRAGLERLSRLLRLDDAVRFLGHVSHPNVATELSKAEVFLHMSLSERLPNVVKEAMASRCLCVVTATKGINELIIDRENGFVVDVGSIATASARIDDVFGENVEIRPMLDAASAHVARNFNATESMRSHLRHWTAAISVRAKGYSRIIVKRAM
jgi:glycosyltransferase involved in cell wall biosynthesis